MQLKREVGGYALKSHGNTLLIMENHGKSWNCVFEFLWEPCYRYDQLTMCQIALNPLAVTEPSVTNLTYRALPDDRNPDDGRSQNLLIKDDEDCWPFRTCKIGLNLIMGLVVRKPAFRVFDKASFKPVSPATETS